MLTPEIAKNILVFLNRVDLKGSEAPALMECNQALIAIIKKAEEAEAPKNIKEKQTDQK